MEALSLALLSISGQTHKFNLRVSMSLVYAKFRETLICYFLTNRKFPFFPLANKGARQVMNLVAAD